MNAPKVPPMSQPQLKIEVPSNLASSYANFALITQTFSEIIVDFACLMPNANSIKVESRVVMTPANAKLLYRALCENLSKFEGRHGEIKLPPGGSLADFLFRPPTPNGEE